MTAGKEDGQSLEEHQVISASRRTDIPMHFSGWLGEAVRRGEVEVPLPYARGTRRVSLLPSRVHSVVLWSKDYDALLNDEGGARTALARYHQLFCHLTITGLGGTPLEPRVPSWGRAIEQIPHLVDWAGLPQRVSVRFDPILHWMEGDEIRSNLPQAEGIFQACARHGVVDVKVSFAALYGKVLKRKGWRWHDPSMEERRAIAERLLALARSSGIVLSACSDPTLAELGVPSARCIDGSLLTRLHPLGLEASREKDRGQRKECGCTRSVDIGAYTMRCPSGCRYCYANPLLSETTKTR
jgi:hypothetical protein